MPDGGAHARTQALLASIVELIPNMIFVKDAAELRFVLFNRAGEDLLGRRREDLLGKNDFDVFPRPEAEFFTAKDREVLSTGRTIEVPEEPIQTATRGVRYLRTLKVPIHDEDGTPQYLLGISEDVTERRDLERKLFEAQKLEALGTLTAGIAHDFGNILGTLIGFAELAQQAAAGDARVLAPLDRVVRSGHRARALVDELFAFSQQSELHLQPTDLASVVQEAVELARGTMPPSTRIVVAVAPDLPAIDADADQLGRVVTNLLGNAAHAMAADGGAIAVAIERRADCVALTVRDDGCGMDGATLAKIFDPFFTTKPRGRGTGLGMSVVHGIVSRHGGAIDVQSEPGRGTSVEVLLPVRRVLAKS